MELNYEMETKKLEKGSDWFKPEAGQYKIKILEIGQEYEATFEEKDGTKKAVQKRLFKIEANGKPFSWGITLAKTTASLYGQLITAGKNLGKLEGNTVTLLVKNNGRKNDYTILEAINQQPVEIRQVQ